MGKKLRRIALTTSITAENCVRTKLWTNGVQLEHAARHEAANRQHAFSPGQSRPDHDIPCNFAKRVSCLPRQRRACELPDSASLRHLVGRASWGRADMRCSARA